MEAEGDKMHEREAYASTPHARLL